MSQESNNNFKQEVGENGQRVENQQTSATDPAGGTATDQEREDAQPLDPNAHDGEIFERVERLRKQDSQRDRPAGQRPRSGSGQPEGQQRPQPADGAEAGNGDSNQESGEQDNGASAAEAAGSGGDQDQRQFDNANQSSDAAGDRDGNENRGTDQTGADQTQGGNDAQGEANSRAGDSLGNEDSTQGPTSTAPSGKEQGERPGPGERQGSGGEQGEQQGSEQQGSEQQGSDKIGQNETGDGETPATGSKGGTGSERESDNSDLASEENADRGDTMEGSQGNEGATGGMNSADPRNPNSPSGANESSNGAGKPVDDQSDSSPNRGESNLADSQQGQPGQQGQPAEGDQLQDRPTDDSSDPAGSFNPAGGNPPGAARGPDRQPEDQLGVEQRENLEHAKQVTDLALEYLEQQQDEPDPELLRQLNWSEEDLQRFVERWRQMKQKAATGTAKDRQDFAQTLRSLGLNNRSSRQYQDQIKSDEVRGLNEDGAVSQPPPEFAREFWELQRLRAKSNRGQPR